MPNRKKILITIPFHEAQLEKIVQAAQGYEVSFMQGNGITEEEMLQAEAIMGNIPASIVQKSEHLKWLQLNSAGADAYCVPGVMKQDQILTNASGAYDISVSENMVAYSFLMMKNLLAYRENQQHHIWKDAGKAVAAYKSTVLVIGLGKIGLAYAKRMKAMGSYVIGVKKHEGTVPEEIDELYTMDHLMDCIGRADLVACVLPGTADTKGMIGRQQFAAMKKTAFFINVGRGDTVDLEALCDALETGELAGAAIDVAVPEPLPADHRAWNTTNLFITPHIAGGYHIPITLDIISDICAENLRRYLRGEPLTHVVNRDFGY